ncbi:hypothetical protein LZC95_08305 [Pendulispora brunnea]|uniref:Tetratricopeptide repeat protein n=1 Tax=Pendulispora brunnea TaxID=2905690 RepID=A0ABZ2KDU0_9BACT
MTHSRRLLSVLDTKSILRTPTGAEALKALLAAEEDFVVKGDAAAALEQSRKTAHLVRSLTLSQDDIRAIAVEQARYMLALGDVTGVQDLTDLSAKASEVDPLHGGRIMMDTGDILCEAGRYVEATALYAAATHAFVAAGDVSREIDALFALGFAWLNLGASTRALVAWRQAVQLARLGREDVKQGDAGWEDRILAKVVEVARELATLSNENVARILRNCADALETTLRSEPVDEIPAESALN